MLEQVAAEYGFAVYEVDAASPAGRRLAQLSRLPQLPGIYVDLELVAWGQPTPEELRRAITRGLRLPEAPEPDHPRPRKRRTRTRTRPATSA